MPTEIKIPQVGESITQVLIAGWQKKEGSTLKKDEPLVTIESDKATVDLTAPASGTLSKIHKQDGEEVEVGEVIGEIDSDKTPETAQSDQQESGKEKRGSTKSKPEDRQKRDTKPIHKEKRHGEQEARSKDKATRTEHGPDRGSKPDHSAPEPEVQAMLQEHELQPGDVKASGPDGQLTRDDVRRHLRARETHEEAKSTTKEPRPAPETTDEESAPQKPAPAESSPSRAPRVTQGKREDEAVRMTPLRRTVAKRLVEAQRTMAILTTFNEIDMSAVSELRRQLRESFEERHGVKLGLMGFFVKATVAALGEFPRLNAEVRGDDIVLHHYCDIGVAIGAGKGLVVPAIRNAEQLGFAEIEQAIADFAARARDNKLTPEELKEGTFTISNGGVYGSLLSTPIINPPQSAILGLHAIQDRPVVRDGEVVIRPLMNVALSYDHRIVDGREAVTFLRRIKEFVESPPRLLLEV